MSIDFVSNGIPEQFLTFISFGFIVLTVIVHIGFASAVYQDSLSIGRNPELVSPMIWTMAALIGGVFVGAAYWLMHHSALSRSVTLHRPEDQVPPAR